MMRRKTSFVSWLVGRLFWKLVLKKWFTGMHSAGKHMSGHMVIEKAKSFCDELEVTDKCTFSEGSNKKKKTTCKN